MLARSVGTFEAFAFVTFFVGGEGVVVGEGVGLDRFFLALPALPSLSFCALLLLLVS